MDIEKSHDEKIKEFDDKIKDAQENFGEIEIREAFINKADYYFSLSDYEKAKEVYYLALEKTVGAQKRLEVNIQILQIHYVLNNIPEYKKQLKVCLDLEEGSDWEKKNKLAVYEGIMLIIERNLSEAAKKFLSQVDTFNAPEVIKFDQLVYYGCILGIMNLPRLKLKEKVIDNSEIVAVLREDKVIYDFVFSFYDAQYHQFFEKLVVLTESFIIKDPFLKLHKEFILKQIKIVIFTQYLEAFKTVTIAKMAKDFNVTEEFIDKELSQLIARRKIKGQIDKVNGVIDSSKGDQKMELYKEIIKKGDNLIERMHKLMRIANV